MILPHFFLVFLVLLAFLALSSCVLMMEGVYEGEWNESCPLVFLPRWGCACTSVIISLLLYFFDCVMTIERRSSLPETTQVWNYTYPFSFLAFSCCAKLFGVHDGAREHTKGKEKGLFTFQVV